MFFTSDISKKFALAPTILNTLQQQRLLEVLKHCALAHHQHHHTRHVWILSKGTIRSWQIIIMSLHLRTPRIALPIFLQFFNVPLIFIQTQVIRNTIQRQSSCTKGFTISPVRFHNKTSVGWFSLSLWEALVPVLPKTWENWLGITFEFF